MSFFIRDDEVFDKYNKISDVIKNILSIKFHSEPIYDKKCIKAKVREFDGVIKTNFLGNKVRKDDVSYRCCVTINLLGMILYMKVSRRSGQNGSVT